MRIVSAIVAAIGIYVAPSFAQYADHPAIKAIKSKEQNICNLQGVPRGADGKATPTTPMHRGKLYLRCELMGGTDEYTTNSCCDHLQRTDADRTAPFLELGIGGLKVCRDDPVNAVEGLKQVMRSMASCQ